MRTYVSKICYYTNFQHRTLCGANVAPTTKVRMAAKLAGYYWWQEIKKNTNVKWLLVEWFSCQVSWRSGNGLNTHGRSRILLEKLIVTQLVKKFPTFYGTRHWSLSWARWIQSTTSHNISLRYILILSSHLRQGLLSCPFLQVFFLQNMEIRLIITRKQGLFL